MRPQTGDYRPALDGLRALCVAAVVAHHTPCRPSWVQGDFGVDVFFALSGWLITTLLLAAPDGTLKVAAFYVRRAFRIVPLYVVTLAAYAALTGMLAARGDAGPWREYLSALPYLVSLNAEYRPETAEMVFGHAWTLGIEEKFYLLWPALLALAGRRPAVASGAGAAALALLILLAGSPEWLARGYLGIGAGAGLALAARRWPKVTALLARPATAGAAAAAMAATYLAIAAAPEAWGWNVAMAAGGAVLSGALWGQARSGAARALAAGPLPWLGRLSYGIYLIHVLALFAVLEGLGWAGMARPPAVVFALTLAGAAAGAWILHLAVERPMIDLGRRLAKGRRVETVPVLPT